MRYLVYGLVLLLLIIHQDNWLWEDTRLIFGFLPVALAYHACISLAAGVVWYMATLWCWPEELAAAEHSPEPGETA